MPIFRTTSTGIILGAAAVVHGMSIPLGLPFHQPQSRAVAWQPAVGTTWQIVLENPIRIDAKNPSVIPGQVEVFDIDLFTNTNNGKDRSKIDALHSLGKKVICYFSAGTYEDGRPDSSAFAADDKGNMMEDWPEWWVNIMSPGIRDIMAKRIKMAADMGCDAIDPDNVDGYGEAPVNKGQGTGKEFRLTQAFTIDYVKWMTAEAGKYNMATGLKNAAEVIDSVLSSVHFSVNEECVAQKECSTFLKFIRAGKPVFHIEYPNGDDEHNQTPVADVTKWCTSSPDSSGPNADISRMSTVIKDMALDGWVQYCDKLQFKTVYRYRPLSDPQRSIRIIQLLPGDFDDDVKVKLHHALLEERPPQPDRRMNLDQLSGTLPAGGDHWKHPDPDIDPALYELPAEVDEFEPHYEALSYVWGSDFKPYEISVESDETEEGEVPAPKPLAVTESLMLALRHLRYTDRPRRLWMDAVCINQDDPDEVSHQVKRMCGVYRLAHRVVAWLGPQGDDSTLALSALRHLGSQVELDDRDWYLFPAPSAEQLLWYAPSKSLPYTKHEWDAMAALLRRPWFHRVWVVQEIQLASKRLGAVIRCGADTIDFSLLGRAVRSVFHKLLSRTPMSTCPEDLFLLLSGVRGLFLPVVDCTFPRYHSRQFAASASRAHVKYSSDTPNMLGVLGVQLAVVSKACDPLPLDLDSCGAVNHIRNWQPPDLDSSVYTPTGEPLRKAYAITLIENKVRERWPEDGQHPTLDAWVKQNWEGALFGDHATGSLGREPGGGGWSLGMINSAVELAVELCSGRAFIHTHEGYIRLAPGDVEAGYVIAVFLGCLNPVVLRPGAQGSYQVICQCFVYGLQDSIGLLGPLPQPWRVSIEHAGYSRPRHLNHNPQTGETTKEDPRLEPLEGWERVERELDGDDPYHCDFFRHKETGDVVNYDPRLEPEMLEKRGVQLTMFSLV